MVSKSRIGNHAMNLLTSVATFREDNETVGQLLRQTVEDDEANLLQNGRPIIFVCHSLGGLVCEDVRFGSLNFCDHMLTLYRPW